MGVENDVPRASRYASPGTVDMIPLSGSSAAQVLSPPLISHRSWSPGATSIGVRRPSLVGPRPLSYAGTPRLSADSTFAEDETFPTVTTFFALLAMRPVRQKAASWPALPEDATTRIRPPRAFAVPPDIRPLLAES